MLDFSVLICSHNPRPDYLRRVLDALRTQTLPLDRWELLLIDNASTVPLAEAWDLSWHPAGRHLREEHLWVVAARLCGIRAARGANLVFVDDDNVLACDYLENALALFREWPMLGSLGASITAEFEVPPPAWITRYFDSLAIHELKSDAWSNANGWSEATPYGAGVCLRRRVAEDYLQKVATDALRKLFGRHGNSAVSGDDLDMAWCALDLGFGTGRFIALKVTHLIGSGRLTEAHIVRLMAGIAAAGEVLTRIRPLHAPRPYWKRLLLLPIELLRANRLDRRILFASLKARAEILRRLKQIRAIA